RGAELVDALACPGADGHDLDPRDELARLRSGELDRLRIDRVDLRERDDAMVDPEQAKDREVLASLWPHTPAGVDDEKEDVDPRGASDHGSDETLMPGDVDDRQPTSVRERERRVPEVDGNASTLLLRQAVRVLPGEGADEPGLPVVDVTCGADGQCHDT